MSDLIILGTDTDVGKTTFALLWMSAFADRYEYWKPVETGPSDTETIKRLVPEARVHFPAQHFNAPVAPPLAAQLESSSVLPSHRFIQGTPRQTDRPLLIETFGGPFSPLNEDELQLNLIRGLKAPTVLVGTTEIGAIGRMLQCLAALKTENIRPRALILMGPKDDYSEAAIRKRWEIPILSLQAPARWEMDAVRRVVESNREALRAVEKHVQLPPNATNPIFTRVTLDDDRRFVWHPYTALGDPEPPLVCAACEDEFLELEDGRQLIDAISSWWTILHGHRHPRLMAALHEAACDIDHVQFAGITHPFAVRVAHRLLREIGWHAGRVFYSDNGSTAVEVALKMAYQFWCHHDQPQRTRFVGFEHGYHGDTFGAMAVSRDPVFFGRFEPLLLQADILPIDPDRLDDHLSKHRGQVAGVIIEPLVQGAGGMRMHTPETLRAIFEVTQRHDVLFIADEVMTGGGRTGTLWAHQAAGIAPDLICAAKTLAGGVLPLAATLVSSRVVKAFETADRSKTFFHGHSFTAHPLACAVACANAALLDRPETLAKPQAMETFWKEAIGPLTGKPGVKDVRIRGSIAAVELDAQGGYLADVGRTMRLNALEMGVLLRPLGSVLYAMPPYCTSPESLQRIADAMHAAVQAAIDR